MIFILVAFWVLSETALATTITKSFEFGAGTENSVSNKRTFPVPCGQKVNATVIFQRGGGGGSSNDVPIVIELRSPGATATEEGPVVDSKQATAKIFSGFPQTARLSGNKSNRGCDLPWIVRVKPQSGQSAVQVYGAISVRFDSELPLGGLRLSKLSKNDSTTVNFGDSSGLKQGKIKITGSWKHDIFGPVNGPMPIRMRVELIDPEGNVVASHAGYSNDEMNGCCSGNKLEINFTVSECKSGQWKLRIKNLTDHDANVITIWDKNKFECPD